MSRVPCRPLLTLLVALLLGVSAAADETTVYLEKSEALAHVFPTAERVVELRHILSAAEIDGIERHLARRLDEGGFYLYAAYTDGRPSSYAVIVAEVGKVRPITHIVEVTTDGRVGRAAVMIYRESHGAEVAADRFMEQYRGMGLDDDIRIDRDVINIAGATLSGHAICRGVKKALAVVDVVLLRRDADERAELLAGGLDVTPAQASPAARAPSPATDDGRRVVVERTVMGTLCRIEAWTPAGDGDPALRGHLEAALDVVAHWDGVLSDWNPDTPLSRLNRAPVGQPVTVDRDLLAWLLDCRRWNEATGGAFDPAVGSLVAAWALHSDAPGRPAAADLDAARRASGLHQIALDVGAGTVTRQADVRLDPGGSGKGYALDRAAERLRARGVEHALLSFRSTLLALRPPPGQAAWIVPVIHDGDGRAVTSVHLADEALSVSGGSFHAFVDGDVERGHVVDPTSGVPVEAGRLAWVRHAQAAGADALSTALLVRGRVLPGIGGARGGWVDDPADRPVDWPATGP